MKNVRYLPVVVICISLFLVFGTFSCLKKTKPSRETAKLSPTQRIVILPFKDQAALKGKNVVTKCAVCGSVFTTGDVAKGAVNHLTERTIAFFMQKGSAKVVPNDRLESVQIELQMNEQLKNQPRNIFIGAVGSALGADIVISGNIYRFEQRIGSALAADTPASVGFDVYMISAPEGRLLWHARFDETQTSLFENLLKLNTFVERKGKWLTAEELAEYGLKKILERSPIP